VIHHRFSLWAVLQIVVAGSLVLMAGCGAPTDPLDKFINATSAREYNRWWNNHCANLQKNIEERYLAAIKVLELEMSIWPQRPSMNDREANLFQMLDGATVRQIVVYGEFVKIHRLMIENYVDADMLDLNRDQLDNVRPGSDLSISFSIEDQIRHLTERMTARKRELDELTAKIQSLMPNLHLDPWQTRPRNRDDLPFQLVHQRFKHPTELVGPGSDEEPNQ
jgi:hypothetical protein